MVSFWTYANRIYVLIKINTTRRKQYFEVVVVVHFKIVWKKNDNKTNIYVY